MNKKNLLFIFAILGLFFIYGYQYTIHLGPYSMHQWRQADCLSITNNYYQDHLPFLEPEINWTNENGNHKTVSEFPLIYYTVAKIWSILGKNILIYRIISVSILFLGLFSLYRIFIDFTKSIFWSLASVIFVFTSQILVYYGNNFLADASALSLSFIGFYFTSRYYRTLAVKWLWLAHLLFLIAGLLKITALMGFFCLMPIHIYYILKNESNIKKRLLIFLPGLILLSLTFAWYAYAKAYNQANISGIFLQNVLPFWEMDHLSILKNETLLFYNLSAEFLNHSAQTILFFITLYCLVHYKSSNRFLLVLMIFLCTSSLLYIALFFKVFDVHDYYLTNLLIVIPAILLTFYDIVQKQSPSFFSSRWVRSIIALFLIYLVAQTASNNRIKYSDQDPITENSFLIEKPYRDYYEWYHYNYKNTFLALENIEPYLLAMGVQPKDKVISVPDESINISLYLMNRKGFTDFGYNYIKADEKIEKFKQIGAKYLIINDTTVIAKRPDLQPYTKNKIGNYKNVFVYKL